MRLSDLREADIHTIYKRAYDVIKKFGYSPYMAFDPYEGTTDIFGALILACGGSRKLLANGCDNADSCDVPTINSVRLDVSIDYLEAFVDQDITEWSLTHTREDALQLLLNASDRIQIAMETI